MPVIMAMYFPGVKKEQYESVRKSTNFEGDKPDGLLLHMSHFDDQAMYVTDIWESPEHFQAFAEARLNKAIEDAGITVQPQMVANPAHNVFNPGYAKV